MIELTVAQVSGIIAAGGFIGASLVAEEKASSRIPGLPEADQTSFAAHSSVLYPNGYHFDISWIAHGR
jgi:hypothetical protein